MKMAKGLLYLLKCYNDLTPDNFLSIKRSIAGKKGASIRYLKYGNPGTPEGRIRGGLASIEKQKKAGLPSPFIAQKTRNPEFSEDLAEFIGIILGDGCINKNQVGISLNSKDDKEYALYIVKLVEKLFKYEPSSKVIRNCVILILISRVNIVNFLCTIGMYKGDKVRQQVEVPQWIKDNQNYRKSCVRGLMDTDGCIYVDKHFIRNKLYKHLGLNFTNRSIPLLNFTKQVMIEQGFHPTISSPKAVVLRREEEIISYMEEIGSSNPKILNKFEVFIQEKARKSTKEV